MKRIVSLLLVILLLAGCRSMYPDEYISIQEHDAPFAYRETSTAATETDAETEQSYRTVSTSIDIRRGIQDMILNGEESGRFLLVHYIGSVDEHMQNMFNALLIDSPKFNYAMEQFDWSLGRVEAGQIVDVRMKLRFTPQELRAIETRHFPEPAKSDIYMALRQLLSSFAIEVSGYRDTDFIEEIEQYALQHPDQIIETPEVSVAVYPSSGSVRVVDLHFIYQTNRETLRAQREDVNNFFDMVRNQLVLVDSEPRMVEVLYMHLVPLIGYSYSPNATVYSQLLQKTGSSRTMASVAAYLCRSVGADCEIVKGERAGEEWYWNRVLWNDRWYYFDLHAAALSGEQPSLKTAEELEAYSWDPEVNPEREIPDQTLPTDDETTEPAETTGPETNQASTEA